MCVGKDVKRQNLREYPNLEALVDGRISGCTSEWPCLRREVLDLSYENTLYKSLVEHYEILCGELEEHIRVPQPRR